MRPEGPLRAKRSGMSARERIWRSWVIKHRPFPISGFLPMEKKWLPISGKARRVSGSTISSAKLTRGSPCRVGHVFGEHLLWGVDQDVGILGLEGEVQIEPSERVLELADRLATPVAPADAHRMQKRQFERPVLGEKGGGVLAVRDGGEEFEQQGLGVQNKPFIFLTYVVH